MDPRLDAPRNDSRVPNALAGTCHLWSDPSEFPPAVPGIVDRAAEARFTITTAADQTLDVFVNPYDARVLGDLNPDTTISGTALRIHGTLLAGKWGDVLIELGACWAVVMTLTGYYLFLKGRKARKRQRAAATPAAQLRSNHARVGAIIGGGLLLLVVSGLPWTGLWGAQTQRLATSNGTSFWGQDEGALSNPTSTLDQSLPHSHRVVPWAQEKSPVPQSTPGTQRSVANVDTAVLVADRQGLHHPFTIALPGKDKGVYSASGTPSTIPARSAQCTSTSSAGRCSPPTATATTQAWPRWCPKASPCTRGAASAP